MKLNAVTYNTNVGNNVAKFKIYALIIKTPPFLCSGVIIVNAEPAFPRWVMLFDAMNVPCFSIAKTMSFALIAC